MSLLSSGKSKSDKSKSSGSNEKNAGKPPAKSDRKGKKTLDDVSSVCVLDVTLVL